MCTGALCYDDCRTGYHWWGISTCVTDTPCPSGYADAGLSCARGATTITKASISRPTQAAGCAPGQQLHAGLCYDTCRDGYTYGGAGVCWQSCTNGYSDGGVFCFKPAVRTCKATYGRGVGTPLSCRCFLCACSDPFYCANGKEDDAALCYTPCQSGYYGVGYGQTFSLKHRHGDPPGLLKLAVKLNQLDRSLSIQIVGSLCRPDATYEA